MSWRMSVLHRTELEYTSAVSVSFNEARMSPADGNGQLLITHDLKVTPVARIASYVDYWGTVVEAFDVHEPHTKLEVISRNIVDTPAAKPRVLGMSWDLLGSTEVRETWCEFLRPSQYVDDARQDEARIDLIEQVRHAPTPRDAIDAAVVAVRDRISYASGTTSVSTTASQAWQERHGVCQDFAHATLSLLRAVGIPGRYVSGYLYPSEGEIGQTVTGQSHAWFEVWDGTWWAFDPTNGLEVGEGYVVVARGRDYADVSPLKGVYAGGTPQEPSVQVSLTRLER